MELAISSTPDKPFATVFRKVVESDHSWMFKSISIKHKPDAKAVAKAKSSGKKVPKGQEVNCDEDALSHVLARISSACVLTIPAGLRDEGPQVSNLIMEKDGVVSLIETPFYITVSLKELVENSGEIKSPAALEFQDIEPKAEPKSALKSTTKKKRDDTASPGEFGDKVEYLVQRTKCKILEAIDSKVEKPTKSGQPNVLSISSNKAIGEFKKDIGSTLDELLEELKEIEPVIDEKMDDQFDAPKVTYVQPPVACKPVKAPPGKMFCVQAPIPIEYPQGETTRFIAVSNLSEWARKWEAYSKAPHFSAEWKPTEEPVAFFAVKDADVMKMPAVKVKATAAQYVLAGIRTDKDATPAPDEAEEDAVPEEGGEDEGEYDMSDAQQQEQYNAYAQMAAQQNAGLHMPFQTGFGGGMQSGQFPQMQIPWGMTPMGHPPGAFEQMPPGAFYPSNQSFGQSSASHWIDGDF
jgi:hypothetical protein